MVKLKDFKEHGFKWIEARHAPRRKLDGVMFRLMGVTKDKAEARRACANYRGKPGTSSRSVFTHRARLIKNKDGWGIWIDSP